MKNKELINANWLIEKGFKCYSDDSGYEYYLQYNKDICFTYCNDFSLGIGEYPGDTSVCVDIKLAKYKHQFENIYKCLTGEEL